MKYIIITLAIIGAFVTGLAVNSKPIQPMNMLHESYTWIKIHEDGSYEGEPINKNYVERGCITNARCND